MTQPLTAADIGAHYECETQRLPEDLRACWKPMSFDREAQSFAQRSLEQSSGWLRTQAFGALKLFVSDYDAYGIVNMYPMHVLSTPQWQELVGQAAGPRSLLDVGAGSGGVTARAASLFSEISVTEASAVLRRRLGTRGFRVLQHDLGLAPLPDHERFDVVSALNVLDRTARPRSLLQHMREALKPGGVLLLAVPLPLSPAVHVGASTVDPDEPLPRRQKLWEDGAASLVRELIEPCGLRVTRLCRVPYLCQGDARRNLYVLDDLIVVCERAKTA